MLEPKKYHAGLGQLLDGRPCGGDRVSVSGRERIFADVHFPGNTGGVREVLALSAEKVRLENRGHPSEVVRASSAD